jgi:hypothetical protein
MKISFRLSTALIAFALYLMPFSASQAMAPKPAAPQAQAVGPSYTWYDGAREQTVWMNAQLVAEFNAPAESASVVRQARPGADIVPRGRGATRIWRVDGGAEAALSAVRSAQPGGNVSPVFHDTPAESGRLRALPGGVIVYLKPAWSEAQVRQWASGRGLEIVRKLEIGTNVYLIKTAPGLVALETANTLYKSGEVVAAVPDWWQEVTTR